MAKTKKEKKEKKQLKIARMYYKMKYSGKNTGFPNGRNKEEYHYDISRRF